MTDFLQALQKEKKYLVQMRNEIEADLKKENKRELDGRLRIQRKGNSVQYYHDQVFNKQKQETYIAKKNIELAHKLAQRDYDNKVLGELIKKQKLLEKFAEEYSEGKLKDVYENLNDYRKALVIPIVMSNEQYAKEWEHFQYEQKNIESDLPEIYTEKGERVRSKSEKMIADKLSKYGIPYRYEAALRIGRSTIIHPDFTILNVRTRKEYYYEHFGMMDNPDYAEAAMKRIHLYESNGIFPGSQLLCSWETKISPINMKIIENMIKEFLL